MRFISGFLVGVLAGMFCILGPIVTFIGGVFVGYKAFGEDEPDESLDKVTYRGMSSEKEPAA